MDHVKDVGHEILRVLCGSRAYGLDTPTSDFDWHAVYVVPTSRILSLGPRIAETAFVQGYGSEINEDNTAWELRHFLEMATQCNPTVIETFIAPLEKADEWGYSLRRLFPYVLSRKRVFDAFRGYAKNQRTKMFDPPEGTGDPPTRSRKAAVAYLRSLYHGTELLQIGSYRTRIPDGSFRDFLLSLRQGIASHAQVIERAEIMEETIALAYRDSVLPEAPDLDRVNKFLLRARKEIWW